MSNRDELARDLFFVYEHAQLWQAEERAQRLWSAGWRKKPSRGAIEFALYERLGGNVELGEPFMPDHYNRMEAENLADAILALLDGSTETGEK